VEKVKSEDLTLKTSAHQKPLFVEKERTAALTLKTKAPAHAGAFHSLQILP
jgi:hypothetical protein